MKNFNIKTTKATTTTTKKGYFFNPCAFCGNSFINFIQRNYLSFIVFKKVFSVFSYEP